MAKTEKDDFEEKDDVAARRSKRAKHRAEKHEDEEDDTHLEGEDGEEEEKDAPASRKSRKAKRRAASEEDEDDESRLETDDVEDEEEDAPASRKSKRSKGRKAETDEEEDEDAYLELDDEDEEETPASRRRAKAMSRKAKRKKAFAYLAAVNELCLLAGRPDKAAAFIAKAVPLSTIRKVLLNARAAQDEATAIMGYAASRNTTTAKDEPKIDTAAIYASRNNLKRSKN